MLTQTWDYAIGFNPPSPCGEGPEPPVPFAPTVIGFNPPSPCGEGLLAPGAGVHADNVSIHPPRVGRDGHGLLLLGHCIVSIHPPRVGRDRRYSSVASAMPMFQSTLPVWGGTVGGRVLLRSIHGFNPPSPCGEGHGKQHRKPESADVSIHPPRVGRDDSASTSGPYTIVSIHPPRVGRDLYIHRGSLALNSFNPPSPCGEGRRYCGPTVRDFRFNPPSPCGEGRGRNLPARSFADMFQSTLPVWGGTAESAR